MKQLGQAITIVAVVILAAMFMPWGKINWPVNFSGWATQPL
jgi:hypothetical protein